MQTYSAILDYTLNEASRDDEAKYVSQCRQCCLYSVGSVACRTRPRSVRVGLHKELDVGPAWPARTAMHRGSCRASLPALRHESACDGLHARRHTRLIAAPTARQAGQHSSGLAERRQAQSRLRLGAL